ncbi:MAG: aminotransferase class V-fold PLP-dependent enzyme [Minisyncoccota bacterium]
MSMLDTKAIKKDFPIFEHEKDLVYLDSAATSQTPQAVLDTMQEYYTSYRSNIHRGLYKMGEEASERYEGVRASVARFIGALPEEIIFTSGATASSNMLVRMLEESGRVGEGSEIVSTVMEHHASLIPLQELAKRKGLTLSLIPIGVPYGEKGLDYDAAEKLITSKTKIVSCVLASNVLGTINDVKRLADLVHKHGALMIVDATEAVGHISVDVKKLGADFLYFSGHKMLGPTGIGVLYGRKELLENMNPSVFGGGIVEKVTGENATWTTSLKRFEAGTPNISGAIGIGGAVEYLEKIGVENIHAHVRELTVYALEKLAQISGVHIFAAPVEQNVGIISFAIDGVHPHDLAQIAGDSNVAIRAGHHCAAPLMAVLGVPATARASFYLYNDNMDVDALIEAIKKAHTIFTK